MDRSRLSQLAVLSTVAIHGNFRAAARELGIAPSAVSHAVSALEQRLGVRLLHRTTRRVAVTEAGTRLLERLQPALSEIDAAVGAAIESGNRPAGVLRITAPRTAVYLVLARRLAAFAKAYPDIVLDLVTEDRFTDVVVGGFDAGVRLGESLQPDMIAVRIGPDMRGALVGSPAYFAEHARPRHPADLTAHRCIRMRFSSGVLYHWEFEKDGKALELEVDGPLIFGEDTSIVEAALSGAGLAFVFEDYVRNAIEDGRLERVLEDWCPRFDGFFVYYPSGRQMRPALRAFVDFFRVTA
jgi:DNA-binding transcriptional LysR family regulator